MRQTVTGGQGGYGTWPITAGHATLRGVSGGAAWPWWQAMTPAASEPLCRCGHAHGAHQHYRRGSDCALCDCPRWRPRGRLRRLLRRRAA